MKTGHHSHRRRAHYLTRQRCQTAAAISIPQRANALVAKSEAAYLNRSPHHLESGESLHLEARNKLK